MNTLCKFRNLSRTVASILALWIAVIGENPIALAQTVSPPTITGQLLSSTSSSASIVFDADNTLYYAIDGSDPTTSSQSATGGSLNIAIASTTTVKAMAVNSGVQSSITTALFTVDAFTMPLLGISGSANLWLRSDLNLTSDASGNISNWNDLSENRACSQTVSANQPTLSSYSWNGLPVVQFGGNQFLNVDDEMLRYSGFDMFSVFAPASAGGTILDATDGSSSEFKLSTSGSAAMVAITDEGTPTSVTASTGLTSNQFQLLEANYNTSGDDDVANILVNGVQQATGTLTTGPGLTSMAFGANASGATGFFNGNFLEFAYVPTSSSDNANVYFFTRYQLSLPSPAAPVISVPAGALNQPTQVAIFTPPDCSCLYSLDGSTPSIPYACPLSISYSQTLKAVATKNGYTSSLSSCSYTLDSTEWPAPSSTDTTQLQINVQQPTQ